MIREASAAASIAEPEEDGEVRRALQGHVHVSIVPLVARAMKPPIVHRETSEGSTRSTSAART